MKVEALELSGVTKSDLGAWRELAAEAVEPNPFFEPEYLRPLARGLGQESEVRLLVAREEDRWHGMLPIHRDRSWHRIPLPATVTWRGHRLYGLLGAPLLTAAEAAPALRALLDAMTATPDSAYAALEWVPADGVVGGLLADELARRSPRPIEFDRFERAIIRRRSEPTYLEETLSSKHRRELRRQRRKLGEQLGAELQVVDRAGDPRAVAELVALEAAASKAESGSVLASDPGHTRFFEAMCGEFAGAGRLQMLELRSGDRTLAIKCNLTAGDTIFCIKIAYDEAWSSSSPGIQLEVDMLKFFHEESEALLIDSCADSNNAMINRLWPDRRPLATWILPSQGVAGRATRPLLAAASSLRERKQMRRAA